MYPRYIYLSYLFYIFMLGNIAAVIQIKDNSADLQIDCEIRCAHGKSCLCGV